LNKKGACLENRNGGGQKKGGSKVVVGRRISSKTFWVKGTKIRSKKRGGLKGMGFQHAKISDGWGLTKEPEVQEQTTMKKKGQGKRPVCSGCERLGTRRTEEKA